VTQIYGTLGFRLSSVRRELGDHIAVELEGAACAFAMDAAPEAGRLVEHLRRWAPRLCLAVKSQSSLRFFRALAEITEEMLNRVDAARSATTTTRREASTVVSWH